jgi:hypothetical protein
VANTSCVKGFVPVMDNGQPVPTISLPKTVGTASDQAIFIGSPVVVASGAANAVSVTTTGGMTGAVVGLKDANGVAVQNLSDNDVGTVIMSYQQNQRYKAHVLSTNYALTDAGATRYLIDIESATATSGSNLGDSYSKRTIGATDGTGQILAGQIVKRPDNAAATAYTEIYCTIADGDWVAI